MKRFAGVLALAIMLSNWQSASAVSLVEIYEDALTDGARTQQRFNERMIHVEPP